MSLNPFTYFAKERQKDRETLIQALDRIFEAQSRQADVAIEQSRTLRTFMDSYMTYAGTPSRRVSTDAVEFETEKLTWGLIDGE